MIRSRGIPFRDEDDAYEYFEQRDLDDRQEQQATEEKRRAAGFSPEQLSIQDAFAEGSRAGCIGVSASLNPYQDHTPEHDAWERGRLGAVTVRAARMVA